MSLPEEPGVAIGAGPGENNPPLYPDGITVSEAYVAFGASVYGLALRHCSSPSDAEDLRQSAFERLLKTVPTSSREFTEDDQVKNYLRKMVVNDFVSQGRRKSKPAFPHLDASYEPTLARRTSPEPSVEDQVLHEVFEPLIENTLEQMNPIFRTAMLAHDVDGLTQEEVAEKLNIKLGTVRSRIFRGRAQFRQIYKELKESA